MNKSIDFYFDFISPYSFLAYKKLKILNENNKFNINYKPILLGGLHKLGGITAPAFNERKMKNMKFDCELIARKNNIEFIWNDKFPLNTLYLMRGFLVVDKKIKNKFFELCFDAYWRNNVDILDNENIKDILKNCAIDQQNFFEEISKHSIKDELKKMTNKAFEKDIFGAPTFVVNNKIFWGQDRLDYALDEYNA
tara:strand:- start:502 stop:1086 length:585 start_codon:yes stop_codon:yes gene_type:complete